MTRLKHGTIDLSNGPNPHRLGVEILKKILDRQAEKLLNYTTGLGERMRRDLRLQPGHADAEFRREDVHSGAGPLGEFDKCGTGPLHAADQQAVPPKRSGKFVVILGLSTAQKGDRNRQERREKEQGEPDGTQKSFEGFGYRLAHKSED